MGSDSAVIGGHDILALERFMDDTRHKQSDSKLQQDAIDARFGTQNVMAVIVPAGDYAAEGRLLAALEALDEVDTAAGLANVEIEDEDYVAHRPADAPSVLRAGG